jgi:outer membrane protein TolC
MRDPLNPHEPTPEFAARLQAQIAAEIQRRNDRAAAPRWSTWTPLQVLVAMALVIVVSMGVGGAVVAATYEAQNNQARNELLRPLEQRVELAEFKVGLTAKAEEAAKRRFDVGLTDAKPVLDAGVELARAQVELDIAKLDVEEVRLTSREPRNELSAPRVSGRDFVSERLRTQLSLSEKVLAVEQKLVADMQVRVEIGVMHPVDLEVARGRAQEVEVAMGTVRRKLDIRQQFLAGKMDAVETQLRVLEIEAEQKVKALAPKIELAKQEVTRVNERVQVGLAQAIDAARATLQRLELERELSQAELDLAVIRQRIAEHRDGQTQ